MFRPCEPPPPDAEFKPCAPLPDQLPPVAAPVSAASRCAGSIRQRVLLVELAREKLEMFSRITIAGPVNADGCVTDHHVLAQVDAAMQCVGQRARDRSPEIRSFYADPDVVPRGVKTLLRMDVARADRQQIDHGVGDVSGLRSVEVTPASDTTFQLSASNDHGSNAMLASVVVANADDPPRIISWELADQTARPPGEARAINYQFTGGTDTTAVVTDGGALDVRLNVARGSVNVIPTDTSDYKLTVSNPHGLDAVQTVKVGTLPKITRFAAYPVDDQGVATPALALERGGSVRIDYQWTGTGATGIVDQGVGAVRSDGHSIVTVEDSTAWTLTVRNDYGAVRQTVSVSVGLQTAPAQEYDNSARTRAWLMPGEPDFAIPPTGFEVHVGRSGERDPEGTIVERGLRYAPALYIGVSVPLALTVDIYMLIRRVGSSGELSDWEWHLGDTFIMPHHWDTVRIPAYAATIYIPRQYWRDLGASEGIAAAVRVARVRFVANYGDGSSVAGDVWTR